MTGEPTVASGACHILIAFDVGMAIDLAAAARCTPATEPETIRHQRPAPSWFQFRPAPLRVQQAGAPIAIAGFSTSAGVECVLYDFGAVSVNYHIPLSGPLSGLLDLSDGLYENRALLEDARSRVERLVKSLGPAIDRPHIADMAEDYAAYHLASLHDASGAPAHTADVLAANRSLLARILRAERSTLADQEVDDALSVRLEYAPGEAAILDWNAALLIQPEAADVLAILDFTNVELLELRRLDDQLDLVLERSFHAVNQRRWRLNLPSGRALRRIAELQMDSALLFESVNNAIKLIGDQYLARVYRKTAERMRLPEWDASILRKLQTAESIYDKLSDRQATRRMEVLEWIIILLIAFDIVWAFVQK